MSHAGHSYRKKRAEEGELTKEVGEKNPREGGRQVRVPEVNASTAVTSDDREARIC